MAGILPLFDFVNCLSTVNNENSEDSLETEPLF